MRSVVPFGQYLLSDRIAVGGMAELFLAKRTGEAGFEKTCVVKRVLPYLAENPEFVRMFLDEARIAARLNHPGVVQVFELGKHNDAYFIAMEYLPGIDLVGLSQTAREKQQTVPVDIAVKIAAQAAEALHYAHEFRGEQGQPLGIVHRDISPSNLFVTCQGTVKVLDFGVAFAHEREHRTQTGGLKGKPAYMSPEQSLGHPVDRRTDIWALGVVLYELLTGQKLFAGDTTAQIALRVCTQPIPSLAELRPDLSSSVTDAVMGALHRDVDQRYRTALEFQHALEKHLLTVSAGTSLAAYVRTLFGDAWVTDQIARNSLSNTGWSVRSGGTEHLDTRSGAPEATVVETFPPSRMRRAGGWAGGAAAVILGALFLWVSAPKRGQAPSEPVLAPVPEPARVTQSPAPTAPGPSEPPKPISERKPRMATKSTPVSHPSSKIGKLTLVTQPYARVFLRGRALGTTPLFDVELPTGMQSLRLVGEDGVPRHLQVEIHEGAATQLRLHLKNLAAARDNL